MARGGRRVVPLRALVVDDEEASRRDLFSLLVREGVEVEEAASAEEALERLRSDPFDAVFLDIRMPGLTGLEAVRVLQDLPDPPLVVFVTAYPDHALDAFEEEALDYLVKPVAPARLRRTLERLERWRRESIPLLEKIPVPLGDRTLLLDTREIRYVSASGDTTSLATYDASYTTRYTLRELRRRLGPRFLQVHRSYLVNLDHIVEVVPFFKGTFLLRLNDRGRTRIPVSRREAARLRLLLGL